MPPLSQGVDDDEYVLCLLKAVFNLKYEMTMVYVWDSFRLPEGFRRIGYDADTMRYTFTDKHEKLYRSAPGEEYGMLMPVGFSASADRPGAFSDREPPKVDSSRPTPSQKLTFSDFLPPSAMTSLDQNLPAPPPKAHFNGAMRTALSKMQGVIQNLRRSLTSADHASPPGGKTSTSNTASHVAKLKGSKCKA
ncbi:uncharacterized protein EV420DRAFT_1641017 [Desarmillaria tabescens]|uniref:Uncharacterized protein n=1 Tax=Armillaria tabescens TaxID=1929756 RepID=A0AA39N7J2_ARMTA|nr:uncharacterized protein EV420DRAFT_1641017 [Desarmillaria tabescens]KAK0460473.1 hypothetical protein EV420DRAFT_1641017 [Desarmillaria tabescens]